MYYNDQFCTTAERQTKQLSQPFLSLNFVILWSNTAGGKRRKKKFYKQNRRWPLLKRNLHMWKCWKGLRTNCKVFRWVKVVGREERQIWSWSEYAVVKGIKMNWKTCSKLIRPRLPEKDCWNIQWPCLHEWWTAQLLLSSHLVFA